jgi:hypothetical protein
MLMTGCAAAAAATSVAVAPSGAGGTSCSVIFWKSFEFRLPAAFASRRKSWTAFSMSVC